MAASTVGWMAPMLATRWDIQKTGSMVALKAAQMACCWADLLGASKADQMVAQMVGKLDMRWAGRWDGSTAERWADSTVVTKATQKVVLKASVKAAQKEKMTAALLASYLTTSMDSKRESPRDNWKVSAMAAQTAMKKVEQKAAN